MDNVFNLEILSFQKMSEIENAWMATDYISLLAKMGFGEDELGGLTEPELKEMCLMSLNDLEHHESANLVLTHVIKDEMSEGQIDQISHHMIENKLWEEHATPAFHMGLFNAYGLLRQAYNGIFAEPTGVKFTVKITAHEADAFEIFEQSLHAVIVRLVSNGLTESAILNRLFEEQMNGVSFPSAQNILWILKECSQTDTERQYEITSSYFWFGELENIQNFEASAHADSDIE